MEQISNVALRLALRALAISFLIIGPGVCSVSASQADVERANLLKMLKRCLAAMPKAVPQYKPRFESSCAGIDVQPLVGVSRKQLVDALGPPDADKQIWKCPPFAPCYHTDTVDYSFYVLPNGWKGGGPELWLSLDRHGVVQHASWGRSK
jgi:hypothetical protein